MCLMLLVDIFRQCQKLLVDFDFDSGLRVDLWEKETQNTGNYE